mmetsp:Transcript_83172/g.166092  ORF Transcript_83172/g.166092 Transcript_83172/m.166092 type:complete len:209 (-) Transcript_83172:349-975(-)
MLGNINLLYLGLTVLILTDRTYLGRFWTQFEAWLSMQVASNEGLVGAPTAMRRCIIECVHGAPEGLKQALIDEWSHATAATAHNKLSLPDVSVTNMSDKLMQLPKIKMLDEVAREVSLRLGLGALTTPQAAPTPASIPAVAMSIEVLLRENERLLQENQKLASEQARDKAEIERLASEIERLRAKGSAFERSSSSARPPSSRPRMVFN